MRTKSWKKKKKWNEILRGKIERRITKKIIKKKKQQSKERVP
jgi:hypothetical protein